MEGDDKQKSLSTLCKITHHIVASGKKGKGCVNKNTKQRNIDKAPRTHDSKQGLRKTKQKGGLYLHIFVSIFWTTDFDGRCAEPKREDKIVALIGK